MKTARLPLAAAATAALLSACAPVYGPPPPPPGPPPAADFRAQDFAWSTRPGTGRVDGRLAYRQGQTRYTCAGAAVLLTPETPWSRRRMTILYNSPERAALPTAEVRARTPSAPSGDYSAFVRRTTCGSDDRFTFTGLPNGPWFVITVARPAGGAAGTEIAIMRRIEIRGGRPVVVDL
ncbi:MAG: hypothetical protein ACK41C_09350 [Phenylobacterium sp.]|uniref:hypothetical protein n=1 Tax=Phenylobacterium sp. TaxID=1871053 RepID=UPI00391A055F